MTEGQMPFFKAGPAAELHDLVACGLAVSTHAACSAWPRSSPHITTQPSRSSATGLWPPASCPRPHCLLTCADGEVPEVLREFAFGPDQPRGLGVSARRSATRPRPRDRYRCSPTAPEGRCGAGFRCACGQSSWFRVRHTDSKFSKRRTRLTPGKRGVVVAALV